MKFLATGKLQGAEGPRLLLSFALLFALCFLGAHALREASYWSFSPERVASELAAPDGQPRNFSSPESSAALQDLHIDLFLFSFLFLLIASTLQALPLPAAWKRTLICAAALTPLLYQCFRYLMHLYANLAWAALATAPALYLCYLASIATLLAVLWRRSDGKAAK
ncbi:MAG: hypothetical protein K1X75_08890 [Leptospirales bacterium]|nr:hypothetical protein [Leptospirales bacterium]